MAAVRTDFRRTWMLRVPPIIRYLDAQHVDAFFERGELRLVALSVFRRHADEQRFDGREGTVMATVPHEGTPTLTFWDHMPVSYVLCGTLVENTDLQEKFGGSGFRIHEPLAFADHLSKYVPGFDGGSIGPCDYSPKAIATAHPDHYARSLRGVSDPTEAERRIVKQSSDLFFDTMFHKHLSFAHQAEFRFLWFSLARQQDHLIVNCPEAVQCCSRL